MGDAPDEDRRGDGGQPVNENGRPSSEDARERRRRYDQTHKEQHAASSRRWKEAHPERVRELNERWRAKNLDRSRQLNRESARRSTARKRRLREKRRRANEASKRWKEAHPEHVREYRRRWAAANRDKLKEYYERYRTGHRDELNARATAWRDSAPEAMKLARKAWADRNKERTAEIQRKRRNDPEKYQADLAANAAARRLRKRLERAGLPPKQLHRSTAAERRANERAAHDYFSDPVLPERIRQFTLLTELLADHLLRHGSQVRAFADAYVVRRARVGLPPVDADGVMYARAVEVVLQRMRRTELLSSRDVAAAVRSAKVTVAAAERERQLSELVAQVQQHRRANAVRLREDADLENLMRLRRGKPRLPADQLVVRIALQEVVEASRAQLDSAAVRRIIRDTNVPVATPPVRQLSRSVRSPLGL